MKYQPISIQWMKQERETQQHASLENGLCAWMDKPWPEIPNDDFSPRGPLYGKVENLLIFGNGGCIIVNRTGTEEEAVLAAEREWKEAGDDKSMKYLCYTECGDGTEGWMRHALKGQEAKDLEKKVAGFLKILNHAPKLQSLLDSTVVMMKPQSVVRIPVMAIDEYEENVKAGREQGFDEDVFDTIREANNNLKIDVPYVCFTGLKHGGAAYALVGVDDKFAHQAASNAIRDGKYPWCVAAWETVDGEYNVMNFTSEAINDDEKLSAEVDEETRRVARIFGLTDE